MTETVNPISSVEWRLSPGEIPGITYRGEDVEELKRFPKLKWRLRERMIQLPLDTAFRRRGSGRFERTSTLMDRTHVDERRWLNEE